MWTYHDKVDPRVYPNVYKVAKKIKGLGRAKQPAPKKKKVVSQEYGDGEYGL
eukprot:CAMPEP_0197542660 /NCGR_PEP_ID=MMETSP1318-20131121/67823_1 /TAXON_ID=552666 /ORGANISM="Partenskyella glossopodia, Strain RCC365" /LENGTH=51 /DNA_ID=CAMNT_0043101939 /DNA_START=1068 /DNA_END=1223 /DNA_ORIENTATION=-